MRSFKVVPLLAVLLWPVVAAGQQVPVRAQSVAAAVAESDVVALRLSAEAGTPDIDGLLAEPAWQSAPQLGAFRQAEPAAGEPASQQTDVRVLFDGETLYIGMLVHDADAGGPTARVLQRDRIMTIDDSNIEFAGDDAVAIVLDPFHDHRNAFLFATNPNGAQLDALITDEGREINMEWRGIWEVRAQRTAEGWSAEFAIPFRTLRYPVTGPGVWGVNVARRDASRNELSLWRSWSRENEGLTRISRAGHLGGMQQLPRSSANIEVKPFVLAGAARDSFALERAAESQLDVGFDLKYEVRPGLVLDATLNTDFAQVEADDEQVNLTRFDLFFPEKREFFLENAGVFEYGVRDYGPPPFLLFFSRQIGIADDAVAPIAGGVRLSGRAGNQTVGLLNVVVDPTANSPRTNFSVARVKRDIGGSNYLGAIVTDRRSAEGGHTAGGADFTYWPTRSIVTRGFVAGLSAGPEENRASSAYGLVADYTGDRSGFSFMHVGVGRGAEAPIGFVLRDDTRLTKGLMRLTIREPFAGVRQLNFWPGAEYVTRLSGAPQDRHVNLGTQFMLAGGDEIGVYVQKRRTWVDEAFELTDDIVVQPGSYLLDQAGWFVTTSGGRAVQLSTDGLLQHFYGGDLFTAGGTVTVAPTRHLSVAASYTRNQGDLPAGSFTADVGSLRLGYAFNTRLFANALVQYNSLDRRVGANIRINFMHRPGSDLFLVLNEQRGGVDRLWDPSSRGGVAKLTYLLRL